MIFSGIWGGLSLFPSRKYLKSHLTRTECFFYNILPHHDHDRLFHTIRNKKVTFYKRNFARKTETVPPLSEKLAARLQQVINAEITAVLSIPLVATLMSRGVWYWDDFPWPAGLVAAILATIASFYLYGKQALTWTEDEVPLLSQEE